MAKGTNGETKPTRARRRTDKAAQTVPAQAPDKMSAKAQVTLSAGSAIQTPSLAEVQRRAYELYVKRGGGHGRDLEDWLEAERQLRREPTRS